jgi:hypothetical protein
MITQIQTEAVFSLIQKRLAPATPIVKIMYFEIKFFVKLIQFYVPMHLNPFCSITIGQSWHALENFSLFSNQVH